MGSRYRVGGVRTKRSSGMWRSGRCLTCSAAAVGPCSGSRALIVRVLHVVNHQSHESVPFEFAGALGRGGVEVAVAPWYAPGPDAPGSGPDLTVFPLGAGGRLSRSAAGRLRRAISEFVPDIVHVHHFPSAQIATALVGRAGGTCLVKTEHNDHRRQRLHQNLTVVPVLARADAVVCNSAATRASMFRWERRLTRGRVRVIHNGVDVERVRRAEAAAVAFSDGFVIATVGRLVPQKNLHTLIEAVGRVVETAPSVRLVIIGGGPGEASLRSLVRSRGLEDVVRLTGDVHRDTVYGHLRAARAFALASHWEGFCNAAVEAMAAGLPMAVSDLPVLREVLGDVPVYFDPTDVGEVSRALEKLVHLEVDAGAVERGARRASDLSLDASVRRHVALYSELVASS